MTAYRWSSSGCRSCWLINNADYVSRQLFVDIMESEEEHIDWLETQLGLIDKPGLQNYLQTAMQTVKPE